METTSNSPMLIVEDVVIELQRLSSLCSIIIWMSDENGHPEINGPRRAQCGGGPFS